MLAELIADFRRHQQLAESGLAELDDISFFKRPAPHVNPVAVIVKHVAGNLRSRWKDFLTTDGEKPDRNRDGEFQIQPEDSRERLMAAWQAGFNQLWSTLESLSEADCTRTVTIRGEKHTVYQVALRSLTHTAYHTGQIVYLVRYFAPNSRWLTVPPAPGSGEKRTQ
jgi:uncharacterized damage-inducible protein DinB